MNLFSRLTIDNFSRKAWSKLKTTNEISLRLNKRTSIFKILTDTEMSTENIFWVWCRTGQISVLMVNTLQNSSSENTGLLK